MVSVNSKDKDELFCNIDYDGLSKAKLMKFKVVIRIYFKEGLVPFDKDGQKLKKVSDMEFFSEDGSNLYVLNKLYEFKSDLQQINTGNHYQCGVEKSNTFSVFFNKNEYKKLRNLNNKKQV